MGVALGVRCEQFVVVRITLSIATRAAGRVSAARVDWGVARCSLPSALSRRWQTFVLNRV